MLHDKMGDRVIESDERQPNEGAEVKDPSLFREMPT
jgi:hypothetical protein